MAFITNHTYDRSISLGIQTMADNTSDAKLIIYQGTMPADPDTWTEAGSSANELAQTSNSFTLTYDSGTADVAPPFAHFSTIPPNFNASATGTAAWYVIVRASDATSFLMGEVSTSAAGTGTLFLTSTSLVNGSPVTVVSFGISTEGIG